MNQTSKTFDRLTKQLVNEIQQHPHKHEIVELAIDQLLDDTDLNDNLVGTIPQHIPR